MMKTIPDRIWPDPVAVQPKLRSHHHVPNRQHLEELDLETMQCQRRLAMWRPLPKRVSNIHLGDCADNLEDQRQMRGSGQGNERSQPDETDGIGGVCRHDTQWSTRLSEPPRTLSWQLAFKLSYPCTSQLFQIHLVDVNPSSI